MAYFLGIDISTTGSKAIVIDEKGEIQSRTLASGGRPRVPAFEPRWSRPGWLGRRSPQSV
jgi:sugar (pentulose or hexulose) kinase